MIVKVIVKLNGIPGGLTLKDGKLISEDQDNHSRDGFFWWVSNLIYKGKATWDTFEGVTVTQEGVERSVLEWVMECVEDPEKYAILSPRDIVRLRAQDSSRGHCENRS